MPSITDRKPDLQAEGPTLDVHLLVPAQYEELYNKLKKELPSPVSIKALVDTGASHSVISEDIPQKLGLKPMGTIKINTPSSDGHQCYQYFLRLIFPAHGLAYEGVFTAAPLKGQNINCLIGRDVLANGILIYIGSDNSFTLSLL